MTLVLKNRVKVTSTSTGTGAFTLGSAVAGYQDFAAVGDGNQTYYCITDDMDWETGIGTYTDSGTTLARDQVFASSNNNALVDWGAGTKEVFCGYAAEAMPGGVPYFDDSQINTDLAGWKTFQAALQSGVVGGVSYDNFGIDGNPSAYSLVYTTGSAYWGGVLAPNGDIHLVPLSADRGQKISAAGVVSTYSLVYTTSSAYAGGVLAPNGDIHFINSSAEVGQKVSPAGVVSTYSLVYTAIGAYAGGVLSPNGDVYFVPISADRGQKISTGAAIPFPLEVCLSSFLNKF